MTAPFAWNATAQIARVAIDFIETVTYRRGKFYRSGRVVTGPPGPEVLLSTDEMHALLAELNDQREQQLPGVDERVLQKFIDLLSEVLG